MSDVKFVRIRGRIVPIRKKDSNSADPQKGAIKTGGGVAIGIASAVSASKDLKRSFGFYNKTTNLRSASKLATFGSNTYSKLITKASKAKLSARTFRNLSRKKFGVGLAISTALISSGVSDFFRKDSDIRDEVSGAIGTAAGAAIVATTAKKFGIRASSVGDLFVGFNRIGRARSMDKIRRISKTKFKAGRVRKNTQLKFKF